jgi:hypothetical protein
MDKGDDSPLWNLEGVFLALKQTYPECECPSYEECAEAGDSWQCAHCLAEEGHTILAEVLCPDEKE